MRRAVSPLLTDFAQQRKADETEHLRRQVKRLPFQDYREIEMVFTGTAATSARHGLGRTPKGWIVVDRNASLNLSHRAADVWDANTITLYNSVAISGTATVWVF